MVWWICLAVVVVALVALGAMFLELRAKTTRLQKAITLAQQRTEPGINAVRLITAIPRPSLALAKPEMRVVGAVGGASEADRPR